MAVQRDFEPEPQSAQAVRRFVEDALPGAPSLDDVVLAASEFAANVIRHAQTSFTVRLNTDEERVRLEVSDGSSIIPAVEDLSESYRGLRMIEAISSRWGVEATESGKTVWAEFSMSPGGRG
jgi:anti-sigma regulatory factor (Ser/Thr protein kinase)